MGRYLVRGFLQAIVLVVLVSIIVFALIHAAPGGPGAVMADDRLSPDEIARMRANLGLDKPLPVQYVEWARNLLTGDFGISYADGRPVLDTILQRVPNTLILAGTAFLLSLAVAIPVGVFTGARSNSKIDNLVSGLTFVAMSVPVFWIGIIGIILFSVTWGWLPSSGMYTINQDKSLVDLLKHLVMPAIVLSLPSMAMFTRFVRVSVLETLQRDYVRTARAKGLSPRAVMYRHVLRTALMPIITIVGISLPAVVTGAAVTESVFGWPGMGRLGYDAILSRDFPVILTLNFIAAVLTLIGTLVSDVLYALADPRIKF